LELQPAQVALQTLVVAVELVQPVMPETRTASIREQTEAPEALEL
jgi:hypothetical protein